MSQLMKSLDEWKASQLNRLGTSPIVCPNCKAQVSLAATCSSCGKPLPQGRFLSRILLLVVPVVFLSAICGIFFTADMLKNAVKTGPIVVVIVLVAVAMMKDVTSMMGGLASALFLPASPREKYLRLAYRVAADKTVSNDIKARLFGFALCQPYVALSEWHMLSDRSCGLSFWKEKQNADDVAPATREAVNDLVFIESLQDCVSRGYVPSNDYRIDCMVATANDGTPLLKVAETIHKESGEWERTFLGIVTPKIIGKAPKLAAALGPSVSTAEKRP